MTRTLFCVALTALAIGCGGDKDGDSADTSTAGTTTGTTAGTTTGSTTGTTTMGTTGMTTGTTTGMTGFTFATNPASDYTRVDRMGMPAVATAVITSKDAYNADDPDDDATFKWAGEITANVQGLHAALDDDLTGLLLTPCDYATCVAQAAPLVIPDTISIDVTQPAGFANGRMLEDPVIDVTLAVVLLDLSVHGLTDLVGVNPTANDVAFQASFPWLAPPH